MIKEMDLQVDDILDRNSLQYINTEEENGGGAFEQAMNYSPRDESHQQNQQRSVRTPVSNNNNEGANDQGNEF